MNGQLSDVRDSISYHNGEIESLEVEHSQLEEEQDSINSELDELGDSDN